MAGGDKNAHSGRRRIAGVQRSPQIHRSPATLTGVAVRPAKTALRRMMGHGQGEVSQY